MDNTIIELQRKIDSLHELVDAVDLADVYESGEWRTEPNGFVRTRMIRDIFGWLPSEKAMEIIREKKEGNNE